MFKIHFLNVGHGDSILVEFPERVMLVDICNGKSIDDTTKNELLEAYGISCLDLILSNKSPEQALFEKGYNVPLTNPIEYIKDKGIDSIFRFVISHPHMDHMTGLYDLFDLERIQILNFWHSGGEFEKPDFENQTKYKEEDWNTYIKLKNSTSEPKNIVNYAGAKGDYWTQDGIRVLCPTAELVQKAVDENKPNDSSYVLLITHEGYKILLAGDAEKNTWDYIVENYPDEIADIYILKAAHHGRDTGFHEEAVKIMNPTYTVVSVGKKPDNDAHNKYKKYTKEKVLSTRYRGNIIFQVDDNGKGTISWEYNKE